MSATFLQASFFFDPPDLDYFRKQAHQFGFNQNEYMDALSKVPVFSYDHVKKNVNFMLSLTQLIGEMGLEKLEKLKSDDRLKLALESARMGTWKYYIDTSMDTRDGNLNKLLGLEAKESTQSIEDFIRFIHPEDKARVSNAIKTSIKYQKPYSEILF